MVADSITSTHREGGEKNVHTLRSIKVVTTHCDHVTMACYPFHHHMGLFPVITTRLPVGGDLDSVGLFGSTSEQSRVV